MTIAESSSTSSTFPREGAHAYAQSLSQLLRLSGYRIAPEGLLNGQPAHGSMSEQVILRAALDYGCTAEIAERAIADIPMMAYPVLLFLQGERSVILLQHLQAQGAQAERFIVVAPDGTGNTADETVMNAAQLNAEYTGRCLLLRPPLRQDGRADESYAAQKSHWFWGTLQRYRGYYAQVAMATIFINILALAGTFFTMNVYDRVVPTQGYVTLWTLAIGVVIASVFEMALRALRSWLLDNAGKKADLLIGSALFQQTLRARMEVRTTSVGSYINSLREFESLRDFATSSTLAAVTDLPFVIFFIVVIASFAGPLAWIPLVVGFLIVLFSFLAQKPMARYTSENLREASIKSGIAVEAVEGLDTLKALRAEGFMQEQYEISSAVGASTSMKSREVTTWLGLSTAFLAQFETVAIIVWGVYMIGAGELTQGGLIGAVILASRAIAPLTQVSGLAGRYQQAKLSLENLNRIMELPVDRESGKEYLRMTQFTDLEVAGLNFSYAKDAPPAVNGVSLKLQAGERIALMGRIGSGKSTLLKTLTGLQKPSAGQVKINGLDMAQIEPSDCRKIIGYAAQEVRLFRGSLRQNLVMGNPLVDDETFLRVCRATGVAALAANCPRGYDTAVGERGEPFSGGQRQLIGLARLILARPQILLLDEPTSAMDTATEAAFFKGLNELLPASTFILVTHQPQLLHYVQRLMIMDAGVMVADGPKEAVLSALQNGQVRGAAKAGAPANQPPATTTTTAAPVPAAAAPSAAVKVGNVFTITAPPRQELPNNDLPKEEK